MPKVSRESAANVADMGLAEDRGEELDGYAVTFVTIRQDADLAPMLKGLPDDRCQCPHWGYVFSGTLTWRYADHEEVVRQAMRTTLRPAIPPRPPQQRVPPDQPGRGTTGRGGGGHEEHAGDAGRLSAGAHRRQGTGSNAPVRPCCVANSVAAARLETPSLA